MAEYPSMLPAIETWTPAPVKIAHMRHINHPEKSTTLLILGGKLQFVSFFNVCMRMLFYISVTSTKVLCAAAKFPHILTPLQESKRT